MKAKRITKAEALEALRELRTESDREQAHAEADGILLMLIADKEITDAFHAIPKWYA